VEMCIDNTRIEYMELKKHHSI